MFWAFMIVASVLVFVYLIVQSAMKHYQIIARIKYGVPDPDASPDIAKDLRPREEARPERLQ
jgi:hypothetical protein